MSQDTSIRVDFKVNSGQLKQMFGQLTRLSSKIRSMSKGMTKLSKDFKKLDSRLGSASGKSKKFTKALQSQENKQKRAAASLSRLTKNTKGYTGATKKATSQTGRAGSSIGLTGFQFGFLGGMALLAGDKLKTFFIEVVREGIEDLDSMNRAIVQSGINLQNFLGGDFSQFDVVGEKIKKLQREFGEFTRADVGSAFEQIGRAVGKEVSVEDIERITRNLLKIARIDKTGGAGLAKTAVDLKRVMTQFDISADTLDDFLDKLVNVNQQGAIELSQLVSSLGFAGAQAQRFGLQIDETMAITGFLFEKGGRKAGSAGRTLSNILGTLGSTATATNPRLRALGVNITDTGGNFNELLEIVEDARRALNKIKAEGKGQLFEQAFIEEFGFDKIGARGFLSLIQSSNKELAALKEGVAQKGTADALNDALGEGAAVKLQTFENELRNLKGEFASGIIPALTELTRITRIFSENKDFVNVLKEFGQGMGEMAITLVSVVLPVLQFFADILKDNTPLVKALAGATVLLVAALSGLGVIFLTLGAFFSIIRIHENLIIRGKQLGNTTNFVAKQYVRLTTTLKKAAVSIGNAFRNVSTRIFSGLTGGMRALIPKFLAFGAKAGLFFGAAFNILANAFIAAGAWVKKLFIRIGALFITAGTVIGGAFGGAFTAASSAIIRAGGWILTMLSLLALKLGFGGGIAGVAYGSGFTVSSSVTISRGAWLLALMKNLGVKFAAAGAAIGGVFGGLWTATAGILMRAGAWINKVMVRLGLISGTGGTIAGTAFGIAFGIAAAAAIIIAVVAAIDLLMERVFGAGSPLKRIAKALGFDIPSVGELIGLPPIPTPGERQIHPDLTDQEILDLRTEKPTTGSSILPGLPPAAAELPTEVENEALKKAQEDAILRMLELEEELLKLDLQSAELTDFMLVVGIDLDSLSDGLDAIDKATEEATVATDDVKVQLTEQSKEIIKSVEATKELTSLEKKLIIEQEKALAIFDSSKIQGEDKGFTPSLELTAISSEDVEKLRAFAEAQGLAGDQLIAFNDKLAESIEKQSEIIAEQILELESAAELRDKKEEFVELEDEQVEILEKTNTLTSASNILLAAANKLMLKNNQLVNLHNNTLIFLIEQLDIQIVEVIRNINITSALTTAMFKAQLMFANLIAQGNRAAGKLASLRVSSTGVFSITDPGVSAADLAFIGRSEDELRAAIAAQVSLSQDISIIINPLIEITGGSEEDAKFAAEIITEELEDTLQKVAPLVTIR